MPRVRLAWLLLCLVPAAAAAEESSYFSFAFGGGALVPQGDMKNDVDPGLDVWGRLGWTSTSGLGLVLGFDWAPLRNVNDGQTSLLQATAEPRFTLGKDVVRLWISAGGGVLAQKGESPRPTVNGAGGLDLHVFGNGGFSLIGCYARGISHAEIDYFCVSAGLVFTL
ncbi:MAG TPA: hypothetical protein VKE22_11455 [Haliangiales bacterium]|nr:hypothetical protein [Haliangiales bacterium]